MDAATAGSITGVVQLDGAAPKMKTINMAAEPSCAKQHSSPATSQDALVGKNGALENVVVYLKGDFSHYKFDAPQTPATITQKGCMYDPHVLVLETGQPLQVVNADPVTHNIHPLPKDNREWNESQPPGAPPLDQSFAHEEIAIPVKCNIHPWMKGYIAVFNQPYFAVIRQGRFLRFEKCAAGNVHAGCLARTLWHQRAARNHRHEGIENRADHFPSGFRDAWNVREKVPVAHPCQRAATAVPALRKF